MSAHLERWPVVAAALAKAAAGEEGAVSVVRAREETLSFGGIQLTSAYGRQAEAQLQASRVPEDAAAATLYGVGLGDVARVLLARPSLKRLVVVILNPAVTRESFARFPADDWLGDPRVELTLASPDDRLAHPFAVVAPCLRLAARPAHPLRDAIVRELNEPYSSSWWRQRETELSERIVRVSERFAGDGDVATFFGALAGRTAFVCGGGPTLATAIEQIQRERGEATVVAVTTALRPLAAAGITADYAVVLDADVTIALHVAGLPAEATARTPLLYVAYADEELIASWPGPRRVFHIDHPFFAAAPEPRTRLFAGGSVVHSALDFAVRAGATRIVLCGFDFAYVGARTHVTGASAAADVRASRDARLSVENGRGELVASDTNLIQYLRATEQYIARHPEVTFLNASSEGARIRGAALP